MKIPKHVLKNLKIETYQEFKQMKRKQLKEIKIAIDKYNLGCAFCPDCGDFKDADRGIGLLRNTLNDMIEKHKYKNWG